jgi:tRNA (guanine26-N2/guanine27-N2)-dimethyltransferase
VGQKKQNGNSTKFMPMHGPAVPEMTCPETGSGYLMGGPIWAERIHDTDFVKGLIADLDKDKSR